MVRLLSVWVPIKIKKKRIKTDVGKWRRVGGEMRMRKQQHNNTQHLKGHLKGVGGLTRTERGRERGRGRGRERVVMVIVTK